MIGATLVTVACATDSTAGQLQITVTNWIPAAPIACARLLAGHATPKPEPIEFLEDLNQ
ncbi:MAG: hypothetical protein NTW86_28490 [Candidatus Sumerlaeota bacterium]|nr:hypothetical protein [Candidatus Sumerlaeota bacterium]